MDMQSVKSAFSILYLEFKTSILHPLEGNDKRYNMNTNNNRQKRPIYQLHFKNVLAVALHSFEVWWISQSACVTSVLYVQLSNYSNNFCLIQSFFQNISNVIEKKTSFYKLPIRHMFYIKLFICSFLFKISFGANICFQWPFVVAFMFNWTIRLLINENWNKKN